MSPAKLLFYLGHIMAIRLSKSKPAWPVATCSYGESSRVHCD